MQYSENYELNLPELADQYNLNHWNDNTNKIDSELKKNSDAIVDLEKRLFLLAHPKGSYWSTSEDTDPNITYGGTWEKITGKFLYASDDDIPVGQTGGSKTNILTVNNLPSHNHSFTPSGNVSAHTHGLNNHTHSFTPKGSLNSTGTHTHTRGTMNITSDIGDSNFLSIWTTSEKISETSSILANSPLYYTEFSDSYKTTIGTSGRFARLKFDASRNWTGVTSSNGSHTHTFTGSAGTTGGSSANTASTTPTFTGTKGNTENTGSAEAVNNMPPYLSANTWHRTA